MNSTPLFAGLDGPTREEILRVHFDERPLVRERAGVKPNFGQGMFVITKGRLEVYVPVIRGNNERTRVVLGRLGNDDFFGEISFLRAFGSPSVYSAEAVITQAPFAAIRLRNGVSGDPLSTLRELIRQFPQVGVNMLSEMARRLAATNRYVYPDAIDRTRLELIRMTESDTTILTASAADIARSVGYVPEAVRKALHTLSHDGVIGLEPLSDGFRITILDRSRLSDGLLIVN